MNQMITDPWFIDARTRFFPHIKAPLWTYIKPQILIPKWENHKVTGTFKARAVNNKVQHLGRRDGSSGLPTAIACYYDRVVVSTPVLSGKGSNRPLVLVLSGCSSHGLSFSNLLSSSH